LRIVGYARAHRGGDVPAAPLAGNFADGRRLGAFTRGGGRDGLTGARRAARARRRGRLARTLRVRSGALLRGIRQGGRAADRHPAAACAGGAGNGGRLGAARRSAHGRSAAHQAGGASEPAARGGPPGGAPWSALRLVRHAGARIRQRRLGRARGGPHRRRSRGARAPWRVAGGAGGAVYPARRSLGATPARVPALRAAQAELRSGPPPQPGPLRGRVVVPAVSRRTRGAMEKSQSVGTELSPDPLRSGGTPLVVRSHFDTLV